MTALRRWLDASIRRRLLWMACAPLLLFALVLVGLTAYWNTAYSDRQLYMKVRADLTVANRLLEGLIERQQNRLVELAHSQALAAALQERDTARLATLLDETRDANRLDWLRAMPPERLTARLGPMLAKRLRQTRAVEGLDVLSAEALDAIDPVLADRARLALRATPRAAPTQRQVERRGLALRTLYALRDASGELRLVLDAGRLLNHETAPVDEIRDLLYGPGTLPGDSEGTVTLFLDDVRIATNVRLPDGERALGTRVSRQVAHRVLEEGRRFIDRAFVVSDWYIAAYAPLHDLQGERIGMFYAGFPEAPFARLYRTTLVQIIGVLLLAALLSVWLALRGVERLAAPIRRMHGVVHAVRQGRQQRMGEPGSQDELAELAREFDAMLERIDAHQQELRRAAAQLERRVDDRTHSLSEKTRALQEHVDLLQQARTRLLTQEKLATLGELTAGIAHEINNPTAVILGHVELIEQQLGENAGEVKEEIDIIIAQVERIRALIDNLLQYSRSGQRQLPVRQEDINDIATRTEVLVHHALDKHRQHLEMDLQARRHVECQRPRLQQVLINLILNAVQAGQPGQIITLATRDAARNGDPGVHIDITDQGPGIPETLRERVFDPFFTTREAGSGLGLAICAGLLRRGGGDIEVLASSESGARLRVWLPCRAQATAADQDTTRRLLSGLTDVAQPGENRRS